MAGQKLCKKLLSTSAFTLGLVALSSPAALAMDDFTTPAGEQVAGGSATFDRPNTGSLNVTQHTDRAVINWDSFNIGKKGKTEFFQPNSGSLAVNRVTGQNTDPTQILGTLKANGRIMVLDRNGVFFGKDAMIDVGGIVASTGDVDTDAVMRGDSKLELTNFGDASVINEGFIRVGDAGLAAFVAPHAANNGVIEARLGKVALASGGERATVDLYGDGLVEIAVDGHKGKALAENNGTIDAEGGTVLMTADAAKDVVDDAINMNGVIKVSSVTMKGGKIILSGGNVKVSGTLDARGANGGGNIKVTGRKVETTATAVLTADATNTGDGGTVELIGADLAIFRGNIFARGGAQGGNGGFVEVSAANQLTFDGFVDTLAAQGLAGELLIDPAFMVIHSGSFNSANYMSMATLANLLISSGTVTVQADNYIDVGTNTAGGGIGTGVINLSEGFTTVKVISGYIPTDAVPGDKNYAGRFKACNSGTAGANCAPVYSTKDTPVLTAGSLKLDSDIISFNKDLIMGTGNVIADASTINLDSKLYGRSVLGGLASLLGDTRLLETGALGTVNVVSSNALINQAIQFADDDATLTTINVGSGNYNESILVDKNNVTLNGAANHGSVIMPNSPGFHITGSDVTVDGFAVSGASGADGYGVWVDGANNVTVQNFSIQDTEKDGIFVNNSNNVTLTGNDISDTTENGIRLRASDDALIAGNNIGQATLDGIHTHDSNDLLIEDNTVSATGHGITVNHSHGVEIADNDVTSSGRDGVHADDICDLTIGGNNVFSSGNHGIRVVDSKDALIVDNTVLFSGRDGISITDTDKSRIKDNIVVLSLENGIHVNGGDETVIRGNLVALSGIDGITVEDSGRYGTAGHGGKDWYVRIVDNDVVLSGRHGISAFNTGAIKIHDNEVALSGTDFTGWIEDLRGGGYEGGDTLLLSEGESESPFDFGFTLNWGNGDGIHVEGAERSYEEYYGDNFNEQRIVSYEHSEYSDPLPAVSISGNDVRWSGGDGIEVRDSGSVRISGNYVEASGINATTFDIFSLLTHVSSLDFSAVLEGAEGVLSGEASMNAFLAGILPAPEFTLWGNGDGIHVENVHSDQNFGGDYFEDDFDSLGAQDFAVRILGNTVVNSGGDGIEVRDSAWTLISGNAVTTTGLLNDIYFPSYFLNLYDIGSNYDADDYQDNFFSGNGISVNNEQELPFPWEFSVSKKFGSSTLAVVHDNDVRDAGENGIKTEAVEDLLLAMNVVQNSGAANLFVAGRHNGDVVLTGNTFTFDNDSDGEQIGALFESGRIDLTGDTNTFNGGTKGLVFRPMAYLNFPYFPDFFPTLFEGFEGPGLSYADMELVDDTIGTTVFNGQKTFYVELANGAFFNPGTPTVLNGLNATYDGLRPANTGGILTQAQFDALENKIFHYTDLNSLGLFFFGLAEDNAEINQEDIFNKFAGYTGNIGPIRITLLGLPTLPGSGQGSGGGLLNFLANIAPAAGGEDDEGKSYETNFELADIEPAAGAGAGGGEAEDASCWSQAAAQASQGAAVSYSFGGSSPEDALDQAAGCSF